MVFKSLTSASTSPLHPLHQNQLYPQTDSIQRAMRAHRLALRSSTVLIITFYISITFLPFQPIEQSISGHPVL